jgi:hypothetical protein
LAKAGLLENLKGLLPGAPVYIVLLRRDIMKIVSSMLSRCDFLNKGNMWLWYLDPDYPNRIVDPAVFRKKGWPGICLWYVHEMLARAEYYRLLFAETPGIQFVDAAVEDLNSPDGTAVFFRRLGQRVPPSEITIPPPKNAGGVRKLSAAEINTVQRLVSAMVVDPKRLAGEYFGSGRRLAKVLRPPS